MNAGPDLGVSVAFSGVRLVEGRRAEDGRGTTRKLLTAGDDAWCPERTPDVLTVTNPLAGTLRGLHVQTAPHEETKAIWVSHGSMLDVLLDLRPDQPTFGRWQAFSLSSGEPRLLVVPAGVAHGYQTTSDNTVVSYLIDGVYDPACARTIRPTSSNLAIPWPLPITVVSERDITAMPWTGS